MEDNFLIPANSKKSVLILGFFTPIDLVIFLLGLTFSIIMLILIQTSVLLVMLMIISPALISAFLIMPVPYYHNILNIIVELYQFFFVNPRQYEWKGWCYKNGKRK